MFYVLYFRLEIVPILTYDVGSVNQAMNYSLIHVMTWSYLNVTDVLYGYVFYTRMRLNYGPSF
jgi:hypothetical protein